MKKQNILVLLVVAVGIISILTACGRKSEGKLPKFDNNRPLKLWVGLNQGKVYRELVKEFEKTSHVKVNVIEQEDANVGLLKDTEMAADVSWVQSDQLGQLVEAGTIYENEKYAAITKRENSALATKAASYDGKLYGYPSSVSAMFLFYDKRVFKESDLKTLDSLFAKGKVGINIAEAGADYRLTPWFISNHAYLYGKNGDEVNNSTLNNQQGLEVLTYISHLKKQKQLVPLNADEISALKEGKVNALFSGNWNIANIKQILGDNMGCAVYPSANFGSGEVKLKAFSGAPLFVVNSASRNPSKAMDLANFITNKSSQLKQYAAIGGVPSNKAAFASQEVQKDEASRVIGQMVDQQSVLMPSLPEMKNFWPNMNAIIVDAYMNKLPENKMQTTLDKLVKEISQPVE